MRHLVLGTWQDTLLEGVRLGAYHIGFAGDSTRSDCGYNLATARVTKLSRVSCHQLVIQLSKHYPLVFLHLFG